jgi:hypothetical protein
MASDFPRSPKLLKGALVVFETAIPVPTNLIVFQYNPDSMRRSFQPIAGRSDPGAGAGDTQHVPLPPIESFQMTVELDAVDQLEASNPLAQGVGLHPTLAALELLLYPPSTQLILNKALSLLGSSIVSPAEAPMVLLVWGAPRVVPVRVTSVGITEQAFDQILNPIRAQVTLGLRVLTPIELQQAGPPFDTLAIVNHIAKEVLARANIANSVQQITTMLPF